MSTSRRFRATGRSRAIYLLAAVLFAVLGALGLLVFGGGGEEALERPPPVLAIEQDGLRYTFHLPTGEESLFDVAADPRALMNLAEERPDDAARLRRELERDQGVQDLEELREHYREAIETLRKLGYL